LNLKLDLKPETSFYYKPIRSGADVDCWSEGPDGCSQTLLHRAIDENKDTIAKFLVRSVELSDVYTGDIAAHVVAVACDGVRPNTFLLKKVGFFVN
jgi:hypothetical protein